MTKLLLFVGLAMATAGCGSEYEAVSGKDGVNGEQGPEGPPGEDGADGADGRDGQNGADGLDGLHCWDLNEDGVPDSDEDVNGDGAWTTADCRPSGGGGPVVVWVDVHGVVAEGVFGSPLPGVRLGSLGGEVPNLGYHDYATGLFWCINNREWDVEACAATSGFDNYPRFLSADCTGTAYYGGTESIAIVPNVVYDVISGSFGEESLVWAGTVAPASMDYNSTLLNPSYCQTVPGRQSLIPASDVFEPGVPPTPPWTLPLHPEFR